MILISIYLMLCTVNIFMVNCYKDVLQREEDSVIFPEYFKFGVSSSAYQIEGGWNASDKSPSVLDTYYHNDEHKYTDDTGDIASDSFTHYKEDVKILKEMNVDFYKFSVSWPRLLPNGTSDYISQDGLNYYNKLVDELTENNIEPQITMYHFDLPQVLQDKGGFLNPLMVEWFTNYADVLYKSFGDRVKVWSTFNEPFVICSVAFGFWTGFPPNITEAIGYDNYDCTHHLIKSHASAWHLYNDRYRESQKGKVGLITMFVWPEPASDSQDDADAVESVQEFVNTMYFEPIYGSTGDYSDYIKKTVARKSQEAGLKESRLHTFTDEEKEYVKGTYDFLGVNHYFTYMIYRNATTYARIKNVPSFEDDVLVSFYPKASSIEGSKGNPKGVGKVLGYIRDHYNNPEVIIYENGLSNSEENLHDHDRMLYLMHYINEVGLAIEDGCNVTAYSVWSYIDNFGFFKGYNSKVGLYHVNFTSPGRERTAKHSSHLYRDIIQTRRINWNFTISSDGIATCKIQLYIILLLSFITSIWTGLRL